MKKLVLILLVLPISHVFAKSVNTVFSEGNEAYTNKNYKAAIELYEQISREGFESAELYYNLGNAYLKLNQLGKSILYFEKAKKINPFDEDINFNLQIANQKTLDNLEEDQESMIKRWWFNFLNIFTLTTWAAITIVLFALGLGFYLLYVFSSNKKLKISFFATALSCLILFGATFFFASQKNRIQEGTKYAIVLAGSVTAKSAPINGADLFILHEGSKVKILESQQDWIKIKLSNNNVGWIPAGSTHRI